MDYRINKDTEQKKTIFYDGSCSMCTTIIKKIDDSPQKEKFDKKDIVKDELSKNLTQKQVEKEIHVIDSSGKIYRNAEAILKILEEYPRWKFIAKVGKLPIIKQILQIGYKLIATNRRFLFKTK